MKQRLDYAEVLDLFLWTMDKLARPTFNNLLAGYEEYEHRGESRALFHELERRQFLQRTGDGPRATYRITAEGVRRAQVDDPTVSWDTRWDGAWRVVTFDLPEVRRKDRQILWRALRARKLGLLQRSVWIWPHSLEAILAEIVDTEGVPECFCGFTARELFLCTTPEVVASAWDWKRIGQRHEEYLRHPSLTGNPAAAVRDLGCLAALARCERWVYQSAFSLDPLLSRSLWPRGYRGADVQQMHLRVRRLLALRFVELAGN
jgi:phenylacetic acid degradation operon negative regulatory protein